jgi:hypothetical protein
VSTANRESRKTEVCVCIVDVLFSYVQCCACALAAKKDDKKKDAKPPKDAKGDDTKKDKTDKTK